MRAFVKTISVSLTVRSSSFDAPSCATEGLMQTGGTEMYCQIYSSGLACSGRRPSSSQSSSDIRLKRSSTFKGLSSSCTARLTKLPSSLCASIAEEKVFFHFSISSAVFLARNLSWTIFRAPAFFTAPFVAAQEGQYTVLRARAFKDFIRAWRLMFSSPGLRNLLKYDRLSDSSSSTFAHDLWFVRPQKRLI
jgi:hypothetical protein